MPTNCWNTDSRMPTQTIGLRPSALPRSEPWEALASSIAMLWWIWVSAVVDVLVGAEHAGQDGARLVVAPLRGEVAGRLGDPQGEEAVDGGRDHGHEEHPAPGFRAEPQHVGGATGRLGEELVGEQRGEDTER